jgi:hypothetical protein
VVEFEPEHSLYDGNPLSPCNAHLRIGLAIFYTIRSGEARILVLALIYLVVIDESSYFETVA